jgi:hypothetical protein
MANGRLKTASFGPAFLGVLIVFCAFAVVAWILFRFAAPSATYEETRAKNRMAKAAAIAQEAQDKLYGAPKWIDKAKGTIQLPIDTAMTLVVNDYQTKAVAPSAVKVDDPYPYGLQGPAAAATTGTGPATTGTAAPMASGTAAAATGTSAPAPK